MNILMIGDIVGNPGRKAVKELVPGLKQKYGIDLCIANGENAAGGVGITYIVAQELYSSGIDGITLGNHAWSKREVFNFIDSDNRIVRPANYPAGNPGKGSTVIKGKNGSIGLLNLQGRIYMDPVVGCPFETADRELEYLKSMTKVVLVDFHAEATSEKCALAWHLDGRVSAVVGTHTHVQTADERILPFGTAFISDVGMTGPYESIIGVDKDIVVQKFISQIPAKFEVARGRAILNALFLDVDESTGKTRNIERINIMGN